MVWVYSHPIRGEVSCCIGLVRHSVLLKLCGQWVKVMKTRLKFVTHTFPYTCMLPVFYHLMSCRAVLCLRGMQNVVVHVCVVLNSVYMPSCPQDNWIIVAFMCKTDKTFIPYLFSFFSPPGTDNESLEQNFSDLLISFVWIKNHRHLLSSTHTHANKRSQQNHTGEPSFWTDAVVWSKGQKKKKFTGGERVPGPVLEPAAWPSPSTRLSSLYSLPEMLFRACKTVREVYYLMID